MPTFRCLFCQHANPASAKFCNECGSGLHLQPCEHCDAINDRDASHCHHCGVALAATAPSASVRDAPEKDALPTQVDEVALAAPVVPAEHRTSVDRAFDVLERDLATLDGMRHAGRAEGEKTSAVARRHHEQVAAGGEHGLGAVRLQPFWRVRTSRPPARALAALAGAGVAFAVAVAGYLYTSPQAPNLGAAVATLTAPVREVASVPSIDVPPATARNAESSPISVPKEDTSSAAVPSTVPTTSNAGVPVSSVAPVPSASANAHGNAPASAIMAKDEPASALAHVAKQDDPAPSALREKQDDPTPASGAEAKADGPGKSAVMAQADAVAAAPLPAPATTPKPRRTKANAARTYAVAPQMFDSAPTTVAPGFDAVSRAPVAGPCTASVAALGLCARGPDAADR